MLCVMLRFSLSARWIVMFLVRIVLWVVSRLMCMCCAFICKSSSRVWVWVDVVLVSWSSVVIGCYFVCQVFVARWCFWFIVVNSEVTKVGVWVVHAVSRIVLIGLFLCGIVDDLLWSVVILLIFVCVSRMTSCLSLLSVLRIVFKVDVSVMMWDWSVC